MLGGEVKPELRHLERAARLLEIRGVEFLVDDAARGGHPLHVAGADDVAVSARVAVLHLALEGDGDGLEGVMLRKWMGFLPSERRENP